MAFNLADVLKGVSDSGTTREQIEYIPLNQIDSDPNNFYELSEVPALADNIAMCGLQQPIRVRQQENGRYQIVSGHRRRAALEILVGDGHSQWGDVPCIVEQDPVSPTLQQLRLIYANANTRKLTSAEIGEQAKQVEKLLYQLKEEGYDFPGRMRDHVAEAVGASKSKLARLKVIDNGLAAVWVDAYRGNQIGESTAYALAQMPRSWQEIIHERWGEKPKQLYADTVDRFRDRFNRIVKLECSHGMALCEHSMEMMRRSSKEQWGSYCDSCCFECSNLQSCKHCCPQAVSKKKEMNATAKAAQREATLRQEERDRPGSELARLVWQRIGQARKDRGISIEKIVRARGEGHYNPSYDDPKQEKQESGNGEYKPGTTVSLGHGIVPADLLRVIAVADLLECSIDWLLGRTDRMELVSDSGTIGEQPAVPSSGEFWRRDDPAETGVYLLMLKDHGCDPTYEEWTWDGQRWKDWSGYHNPGIDGEILGWIPMPGMPEPKQSVCNDSCITGMSPTGHCGAAAYCDKEHTCCLQCDESCNIRCGWTDEEDK